MDIEKLRSFCMSLPFATEDVKWSNNLCFLIGEKMFCVTGLSETVKFSIKVKDEEFDELTSRPGIIPAPYLARYKWVLIKNPAVLSQKQIELYIRQSYELVKSKLPKKILMKLRP